MPKFKVEVCRTYYAYATIEVEATCKEEAEETALFCVESFDGMQIADSDEVISCKEV